MLVGLLAAEVVVFARHRDELLDGLGMALEVLRLSVEIGLLAVALTPVIVSGGIDLSVGIADGAGGGGLRDDWRGPGRADPAGGSRRRSSWARRQEQ